MNDSNEPLTIPPTPTQRAESSNILDLLHPANRFRLMFGQPFLEDDPGLPAYREAMKAYNEQQRLH